MDRGNNIMLVFKHRKDEDVQIDTFTIEELIFGVGETKQSVKDLVGFWNEDGYSLVEIKHNRQ
ncbi:hypothetical protein ACR77J_07780 [Tissierella praeacuta]|uniref:hypothetical protein n=1 Tax=Tissierella praeacuta TaxID=43131 RepID=UPI003DA38DDC